MQSSKRPRGEEAPQHLDSSGSTPYGVVAHVAWINFIRDNKLSSDKRNNLVLYKSDKTDPRMFDIELNDLLFIFDDRASARFGVYLNNGISDTATQGRPAVFTSVAEMPTTVDPSIYKGVDEELTIQMRQQDLLSHMRWAGVSMGRYHGIPGAPHSATHAGLQSGIRGEATLTTSVVKGKPVKPFDPVVAALPDTPDKRNRFANAFSTDGSKFPVTLKPWDAEDTVARVYSCLLKQEYVQANVLKGGNQFDDIIERLKSTSTADLKNAHGLMLGIKGIVIAGLQVLATRGRLGGLDIVREIAEMDAPFARAGQDNRTFVQDMLIQLDNFRRDAPDTVIIPANDALSAADQKRNREIRDQCIPSIVIPIATCLRQNPILGRVLSVDPKATNEYIQTFDFAW